MRSDLVYLYDGSFEGLLCCIFESYEKKETPCEMLLENDEQMTFFQSKYIDTDLSKALRVEAGLKKKASEDAFSLIQLAYYSCHPKIEMLILDFVRLSMKVGKKVLSMLAEDTVNEVQNAVKHLTRESHQLKGFVRFSVYDKVMAAVIEPKNFVLPLLAPHFCDRYANETFLIFDKTHNAALVYKPYSYDIITVEDYNEPSVNKEEEKVRSLWKLFYDTIAIKERENPRCRMSHMQKRYWKHLTEMKDVTLDKKIGELPFWDLPKIN